MNQMVMDYSLTGDTGKRAVESGLADAIWYTSPVPKDKMRELLVRRDGPAVRDTLIWFAVLGVSGYLGAVYWGTAWAVLPFLVYGVIYASSSDSRWHESSHGTAFRTDWMNEVLYEIASFMQVRESVVWRWSHTRHHTDTIIVGRDPEIAVPRPANLQKFVLAFFKVPAVIAEFRKIFVHATGRMSDEAATFVPESEWPKVYRRARIYLIIYASVIALALYYNSWLPLMYIGLPTLYGTWLMTIYGLSQHAGLAENVTDHRLNSRTIYMNWLNRYLYWNMNYHVEHHMFPLVPYHALPKLHELMKDDCPVPYSGLWEAWREIIPAVVRQSKDPSYFVERELPTPTTPEHHVSSVIQSTGAPDADGWIEVGATSLLEREDVLQFDHGAQTFAVYRAEDDSFHATEGICTHGNTHLADGMVKGHLIECPKHNGRFDIRDGQATRAPACVGLKTYPVEDRDGTLFLNVVNAGGWGMEETITHNFRVVSNENVATFIKELVLEPEQLTPGFKYTPGDYIQLDVPAYGQRTLPETAVSAAYADTWREMRFFELEAENAAPTRRNYSIASNPATESQLRFNVRFAAPPPGQLVKAGAGSSYVFGLKPGDRVTAIGPFGDFHIKDTDREMIYVGGGAGMAPMRSHLSSLLETQASTRRISFWYGARSAKEMFYGDFFKSLSERHDNFSFQFAFSEPVVGEAAAPYEGFIHQVLLDNYLSAHESPQSVEFYLCGPPPMMQATRTMLEDLGVHGEQIAYDEF